MDKNKYISLDKDIEIECIDCEYNFIITPKQYSSWDGKCIECYSKNTVEIKYMDCK